MTLCACAVVRLCVRVFAWCQNPSVPGSAKPPSFRGPASRSTPGAPGTLWHIAALATPLAEQFKAGTKRPRITHMCTGNWHKNNPSRRSVPATTTVLQHSLSLCAVSRPTRRRVQSSCLVSGAGIAWAVGSTRPGCFGLSPRSGHGRVQCKLTLRCVKDLVRKFNENSENRRLLREAMHSQT